MISQADIIKTLINKNCTDESVMTTALSPQCTPPKLLEKLMESERFDLALDVSMKLGLDVIPLWRTWAMRCLQNRNFQGAREKFRHCFQRLRLPGGRISPMQERLLSDILKELSIMNEIYLTLAEEIDLIKKGKYLDMENNPEAASYHSRIPITKRPTIYSECLFYLKRYGKLEDSIKFYVVNFLWDETVKILLEDKTRDNINLDKHFIPEVFLFLTSKGFLDKLITAFLDLDSNLILSTMYFKAIYNFCLRQRRYNLLYYVQNSIGDYIAAARTQIDFFFLNKRAQSYRELNQNISSLISALQNYKDYLKKLELLSVTNTDNRKTNSNEMTTKQQSPKQENKVPTLFSSMSKNDVVKQIELLTIQIDITKNFAINEVTGCINGIDLGVIDTNNSTTNKDEVGDKTSLLSSTILEDSIPVTLFDNDERRKTFLAALILIYYDLTCSKYFSKNGLDMANRIINDHGLNKLNVFKTSMRIILEDESCDILENASLLLARINEDYLDSSSKLINNTDSNKPQAVNINQTTNDRQQLSKNNNNNNNNNNSSIVNVVRYHNQLQTNNNSQQNRNKTKNDKKARSLSVIGVTNSNANLTQQQALNVSNLEQSTCDEEQPTKKDKTLDCNVTTKCSPLDRHDSLKNSKSSPVDGARAICDEVIKDSIGSCREVDYKMELAKLLSAEAKIELYIELGKLSNAQRLACTMNRPDYVISIIEEAAKLNQNHVKTVCQLWLAKHETGNILR